MRILKLNLLVGAMLFFGAANASAFGIFLTSNYAGEGLSISDTITVTVHMDFEGETNAGIRFLAVGVRFDNYAFAYSQAASQSSTYLLYSPATGAAPMSLLTPAATCPAVGGCALWPGVTLPRFRRHTIPHESAVGVCHDEANTTNIFEGIQG